MSTKSSAKAPAKKASAEKKAKAPMKAEKESKEEKKTASKKAPKKAPKPKVSTADAREKKRKDLLVEMVKEVKKQLADDDALSKEQLAAIKEIVGGILLEALPAPKGKRPSGKPVQPPTDYFRFRKETLSAAKKKDEKVSQGEMKEKWEEFKAEKKDTLAKWEKERKAAMKTYKTAIEEYNKENNIEVKTSKKKKEGEKKKINSFNLYRREMKKEDVSSAQASLDWGNMSVDDKAEWKEKADEENVKNGFDVGKGSGKSKKSDDEEEADGEGDEEVEADGEGDEEVEE